MKVNSTCSVCGAPVQIGDRIFVLVTEDGPTISHGWCFQHRSFGFEPDQNPTLLHALEARARLAYDQTGEA